MAALFSAEEIIDITGARLAAGMIADQAGEICSDTRTISEGAWFIALPGRQFDGHDFLGDAFSQGALGCIVAERSNYPIAGTSFPLIAVDDTIDALTKLARNWRRRLSAKIIVVLVNRSVETCQSGAICHQLISSRFETELWKVSFGSTEIVLNTVLSMEDSTQAAVAEVSPHSLEHVQACLSALQPNSFNHLQMVSSDKCFASTVQAVVEALDPKKCKLIVASREPEIIDQLSVFGGMKLFFGPELSGDPDVWAAQTASAEI